MDIKIYKLQLEPTNKCNLKCSICWHTLGKIKNIGEMKFELFKKIVDQMKDLSEIDFEGLGEPFLCKDIFKMMHYANQRGINTWTVSNGNLLGKRYSFEIVKSGLGKLRLSVDAQDPHVYKKIRKGGNIYRIMQNIKILNKIKKDFSSHTPTLAFNVVILKENIEDLINIVKLAKSLDVYEITLVPMVVFGSGLAIKEQSFHSNKEFFLENIFRAKGLADSYGIIFNQGISVEEYKEVGLRDSHSPLFCLEGGYINWQGNFFSCGNRDYSFGSFLTQDISDIVMNEQYRKFREYIISTNMSCQRCFYR